MKIARWLLEFSVNDPERFRKFIVLSELLPAQQIRELLEECDQLCRILGKSVFTAKANGRYRRVESFNQE